MHLLITLPLAFGVTALLLAISYTFEQITYQAILPHLAFYGISLGILMALAFNAAKIALAWRIGSSRRPGFGAVFAKMGYVSLSVIASFLVVANYADSPNLDRLLRSERAKVAAAYDARLKSGREAMEEDVANVRESYEKQRNEVLKSAKKQLDQLERDRKAEMKVTDANGNFIGRRYKEIMRQIKLAEEKRDARIADLNKEEQEKIAAIREAWQKREEEIMAARDQRVAEITRESLRDDEAAQSRWLTAGPHLINRMFGTHFNHGHLALLLSILTALVVEMGPLVLIVPVARELAGRTNAAFSGPVLVDTTPDRQPEDDDKGRSRPLRAVE